MTLSLVTLIAATLALCIPGPLKPWPFVALALVTLALVTLILVTLALVTLSPCDPRWPTNSTTQQGLPSPCGAFLVTPNSCDP